MYGLHKLIVLEPNSLFNIANKLLSFLRPYNVNSWLNWQKVAKKLSHGLQIEF